MSDPTTIYPSRKRYILLISSTAAFLFLMMQVAHSISYEADKYLSVFFWALFILLGLGLATFVYGFFAKLPKLILDDDGIRYVYWRGEKFRRWSAVGPFAVVLAGFPQAQSLYGCALSAENHELLAARGEPEKPIPYGAAFAADLSAFGAGHHVDRANELADLLNQWRSQFSGPGASPVPVSWKNEIVQLSFVERWKSTVVAWAVLVAGVLVAVFKFY